MSNIEQDQPYFEFVDDEPALIKDEFTNVTEAGWGRAPVFIDGDEFVDAPRPGSEIEED